MKISIDLDGCLFAHRDFFRLLMSTFQAAGHQVGILTGHKDEAQQRDLEKLRNDGFYPDFYFGRPVEYQHLNGAIFKRDTIREQGIDLHFDDHDYGFPTSVELMNEFDDVRVRTISMPKDREAAKRHGW